MSISKNVGSISRYFTYLRTAKGYNLLKDRVQASLKEIPVIGTPIASVIVTGKGLLRRWIYRSTVFEKFGFVYHGPLDGHDIEEMCRAFSNVTTTDKPLFYHVVTVKGKGFAPAEDNPGAFHGVPSFDVSDTDCLNPDISPSDSLSDAFGRCLCQLATQDKRICGITAAMKYGTCLHYLRKAAPERAFDVGMAEQHAVTFAAGLAKGGLRPVVALYSTFLQRAYDQVFHDVVLNRADVLFAIDRAGLVPGDGATHQGLYDVAMLSQYDGFTLVNPCNDAEMTYWLTRLLTKESGPRAIRYSKGKPSPALQALGCTQKPFDVYQSGSARYAIVCYGGLSEECLTARELLDNRIDLIKLTVLHPFAAELTDILCGYDGILIAEEAVRVGSIGEQLLSMLQQKGYHGKTVHLYAGNVQDHASVKQLRSQQGLDADSIRNKCRELMS